MATSIGDIQTHKSLPATGDDAIAAATRSQLLLVSSFERWLAGRIDSSAAPNSIVRKIQRRLDNYRRWLLDAARTPRALLEDAEPWNMDARVHTGSDDRSVIVVTGPGLGEPIEIAAKDEKELGYLMSESHLGYMVKICHAFAKAQDIMRLLLQTTSEIEEEQSHLTQPAEATVKTYIRGLQEYNDIKDIGQQLIGLVAENRGVPVRALYESGDYGVGFQP